MITPSATCDMLVCSGVFIGLLKLPKNFPTFYQCVVSVVLMVMAVQQVNLLQAF